RGPEADRASARRTLVTLVLSCNEASPFVAIGVPCQKYDDIFGHRDTKTQRRTRFKLRARRGAAQRRARRANGKRTTKGQWLGRSFAVGAPHGAACSAGRARRAPLCLGVFRSHGATPNPDAIASFHSFFANSNATYNVCSLPL